MRFRHCAAAQRRAESVPYRSYADPFTRAPDAHSYELNRNAQGHRDDIFAALLASLRCAIRTLSVHRFHRSWVEELALEVRPITHVKLRRLRPSYPQSVQLKVCNGTHMSERPRYPLAQVFRACCALKRLVLDLCDAGFWRAWPSFAMTTQTVLLVTSGRLCTVSRYLRF